MLAMMKAAVAAVIVQPLVFVVWIFLPLVVEGAHFSFADLLVALSLSGYVYLVATGLVLFLGIPLFLILRRMGKATLPFVSASGFAAGAISNAIFSWPLRSSWKGSSSGGDWHGKYVKFIIDGHYTIYGWFRYLESILMFGVHGLVAAMVFYWVWRRFHKHTQGSMEHAKVTRP